MPKHYPNPSRIIVSSCGTSLLTNLAREEQNPVKPSDITFLSNAVSADAVMDAELRKRIEEHLKIARKRLMAADIKESTKMSAEINGIIQYYGGDINRGIQTGGQPDTHYLVHSDTWLGEATTNIIRDKLVALGLKNVYVEKIQDLRTDDEETYRMGATNLVAFCLKMQKDAQADKRALVFNLTGSYKAIQGYMQAVGMLVADEIVYVYETGQLLRIPRLPVEFDDGVIRDNLDVFRRLDVIGDLKSPDVSHLPLSLFDIIEDGVGLSVWGESFYKGVRDEAYAKKLQPPISDRVKYDENFKKTVADLSPDRIAKVNERMDDFCRYMETGDNLKRLDVKQVKGGGRKKHAPATHEMDAWADKDAKRIYFHYEKDGKKQEVAVIDALGKGMH